MADTYIVVTTTAGSESDAESLAGGLIEGRLAACVQCSTVKSRYRWQGAVESSEEVLLVIKTREALRDQVVDYIKANHPYELPEILVTPVVGGFQGYLDWISEETS